jgi:hypothetical protein
MAPLIEIPRDVLLTTTDSLRADYSSCYRNFGNRSPNIDKPCLQEGTFLRGTCTPSGTRDASSSVLAQPFCDLVLGPLGSGTRSKVA